MDELIHTLQTEGALQNPDVLSAFRYVDRKDFVPEKSALEAYQNYPLSIGSGQTISQPYTVAFMLDLLEPGPGQTILEIGCGSGWQTTMLGHIVGESGQVHAIEIVPTLANTTKENAGKYPDIEKCITVYTQNAIDGLPRHAPFDRIIAAASAREIPKQWKEQLAVGASCPRVNLLPH